ncbi:MAG: diacylglycerol kinase [Betaproteobacteria bacterium RBG_16_56_24]|nr:MAG: diacylglycerol kinase [Betaproteobacteria bacterium RBG_16_56_24]
MPTTPTRSSILDPRSRLSIIVAMAKNRVIGANNTLPWHLPADLKHFKALTMGRHIVMGRKTHESIGKPLPGRTSVVVTRNADYSAPGVIVANSLEAAISACGDDAEIFVIGGAELYRQAIDLAGRIYLTEIDANIPGDAHFTELDHKLWQETARVSHAPDEKNAYPYHFVVYDRKSQLSDSISPSKRK